MIEVFRYQTEDGHEPVTDWLNSLRDKSLQARLRLRMNRLEAGNFVALAIEYIWDGMDNGW